MNKIEKLDIPISTIGPLQTIDVEKSGKEYHDGVGRTCTVLQRTKLEDGSISYVSGIGDTSPYRMAKWFGRDFLHWNRHFIIQVSGCPLNCWYCYVDNLEIEIYMSCDEIVDKYLKFKESAPDINVLHLMGGCPGAYARSWPLLRKSMDEAGLYDDILLTNVLLVEEHIYHVEPWKHIPDRTVIDVCLKGTNYENFYKNTNRNLFGEALIEFNHYRKRLDKPKYLIYYSLIEYDEKDLTNVLDYLGEYNVDILKVKEYEVVKARTIK